ncbi:MAG: hypothetical protein IPO03_03325 [Bacteroidetes bacterium]|nr:hypothetical protein [Bacteroidota bacterium]
MATEIPIINILTYKLPYDLANQIYNEFQSRLKEATYLIDTYKTYKPLKEYIKSVELFLSLSIFHRRVIANLDGALKFYGTVTKKGETDTIRIGNYDLTGDEKNKILAVVMNYNALLVKFSIPPIVMEYYETRDFLKKIMQLKFEFDNADVK